MQSTRNTSPPSKLRLRGPGNIFDQLSQSNVLIPKRDEVDSYLTAFPDVGDVLPEMSAELRRVFGSDAELSLEVNHDPEIVDEYLKIVVRRDQYEVGFLQKIHAVNREFDDVLEATSGYLEASTDFHRRKGANGI